MKVKSINPATEEPINEYSLLTDKEANESLIVAESAFQSWKRSSFNTRTVLLNNVAALLRKNKEEYAVVITNEMGKTLTSAMAEIEKCAWVCDYYAEHAENFLSDKVILTEAHKSFVTYQPLGVILAVMPWNFPFWQVFRFAAPTLMAGNVAVLKHASNVPHCGELIQSIFEEAGGQKGLFINLLISSKQVDNLIENTIIKAVTLTGSEKAGSSVAASAGRNIKKSLLELGGSDAYLILEDADLDLAASQCAASRLLNSGQSCIGAKRFILVEEIYDAFLAKFKIEMEKAILGNPLNPETTLAPLARNDLREELHLQVSESVAKGADLILGGFIPDRVGLYYPATILSNVKPGMPAYHEELFGPVASIIKVQNEEEAISVANNSKFGLGACVFTADLKRGERIAKIELEAGACFVNHFVKSDPRLPFGGIKTSGFGRELGEEGLKEFMNSKTVYVS